MSRENARVLLAGGTTTRRRIFDIYFPETPLYVELPTINLTACSDICRTSNKYITLLQSGSDISIIAFDCSKRTIKLTNACAHPMTFIHFLREIPKCTSVCYLNNKTLKFSFLEWKYILMASNGNLSNFFFEIKRFDIPHAGSARRSASEPGPMNCFELCPGGDSLWFEENLFQIHKTFTSSLVPPPPLPPPPEVMTKIPVPSGQEQSEDKLGTLCTENDDTEDSDWEDGKHIQKTERAMIAPPRKRFKLVGDDVETDGLMLAIVNKRTGECWAVEEQTPEPEFDECDLSLDPASPPAYL